ncbi:hypothetical protein [Pseudarthrobacter sp. S9]
MPTSGVNDETAHQHSELPSVGSEHQQAVVLVHTAWAGWQYETDSVNHK